MKKWIALLCASCASYACAAEVFLVGIAGGSGSGKTTLAHRLEEALGSGVLILSADSYYRDLSGMTAEQKGKVNFDHPNSINFELLAEHLQELKNFHSIPKMEYDFATHSPKACSESLQPKKVVIVEGILVLTMPIVRDLLDLKLYVETDEDIRLLRRIERDMRERERTFFSVRDQYLRTVKPMFDEFVAPSRQYADLIIPGTGSPTAALDTVAAQLKQMVATATSF